MLSSLLRVTIATAAVGWFCFAPVLSQAQYSGSKDVSSELKVGFETITPEQAEEFLNVLASPSFGGRGTGQPGFMKAAHWVAGKAAEFGLEPMGEGGTYFQMMPLAQTTAEADQSKMTIGNKLTIEAEGNLGFERFVGQPLVEGKLAFVRLGDGLPALADDVNLEDKVVIYSAGADTFKASTEIAKKRPAAFLRVVDNVPASSSQSVRLGGK